MNRTNAHVVPSFHFITIIKFICLRTILNYRLISYIQTPNHKKIRLIASAKPWKVYENTDRANWNWTVCSMYICMYCRVKYSTHIFVSKQPPFCNLSQFLWGLLTWVKLPFSADEQKRGVEKPTGNIFV